MRTALVVCGLVFVSLGCGGSITGGELCGRGTHDDKGYCVADDVASVPTAPSGTTPGGASSPPDSAEPPAERDAGASTADSSPPADAAAACADGVNAFVIAGNDWVYSGPGFELKGGTGWVVTAADLDDAGHPLTLSFSMGNNWQAKFSTHTVGTPIAIGSFKDAQRYPFEDPNHPGLDVSGDGRGCNEIAGDFTVTELAMGEQDGGVPYVKSATVTFNQHCEGGSNATHGCVHVEQ